MRKRLSSDNIRHQAGRLASRLKAFHRDRRGAAAVLFAVALVVLAPLTLGVMDIYMGSSQRNELQDALDAATLFAARSPANNTADLDAVGDKALLANLVLPAGVTLVASDFILDGDTVTGYAETTPPALAPNLWAHENLKAQVTVKRSLDKLEIALVLDNTGSMAGTKLTTLKLSAKSLIDKLVAASAYSSEPTPLKVSLVPFSMSVRVQGSTPTSAYNVAAHSGAGFPTWLDPEGKAHVAAASGGAKDGFKVQTDRFAMLKAMSNEPWAGCVESRRQPYDVEDTAPSPSVPATMFVPYFWPDEPDASAGYSGYANDYLGDAAPAGWTWKQREQNPAKYVVKPKTGSSPVTGYPLGPNAGCNLLPLIRLTADTNAIKAAVDSMVATGNTNIPMGMVWGWHTLSPNTPFADGVAYSTPHVRKILILMTDGENTMDDPPSSSEQNKSYYSGLGYIWQGLLGITSGSISARTSAMDARLALLCSNVKAKGIIVYTVRVEVKSGPSPLLEGCASSPDNYYDVQDVSQLKAAFDAIAGSIDNLRLAK